MAACRSRQVVWTPYQGQGWDRHYFRLLQTESTMPMPSKSFPDPDDPRKPEGPPDLSKRQEGRPQAHGHRVQGRQLHRLGGGAHVLRRAVRVPGAIALLSLIGLVGDPQKTTDALLGIVEDLGPSSATETFAGPIEQIASKPQAAGLALILGLVIALWSASGTSGAFGAGSQRDLRGRGGPAVLQAPPDADAHHPCRVWSSSARWRSRSS